MKVAVIGLDCAAPDLVFRKYRDRLPNITRLAAGGVAGNLRSADPPITVPAWSCMMSGFDAGQLGIYGFRNRKDYSYDRYAIATSASVRKDRVWDVLARAGKRSILLGVPQTYPIRPLPGVVVTDFLTPSTRHEYVHPAGLKDEIEKVADGYVLDVEDFRSPDKASLLERVYAKTRKHFAVARHLLLTQEWDFFMMVEMGVDRIHHGFWGFMDPDHRNYVPGNPFEAAIGDYYAYVDERVGELLSLFPSDTVVFIVSDHGAKRLDGGFCINEWLIEEGFLALRERPTTSTPLERLQIDWPNTIAWGDGGYYGRLFMNVLGREPHGRVPPADYEAVRSDLVGRVADLRGPDGASLGCRAERPEDLYRDVNGVPPDLMLYFGDLYWRSIGSVGEGSLYTFDNDTGPDGANHDWEGIFIASENAGIEPRSDGRPLFIYDVGPTILAQFGLTVDPSAVGRPMGSVRAAGTGPAYAGRRRARDEDGVEGDDGRDALPGGG